ncbi:hypothetical protein MSPGM_08010 [Methylorubrum sp. GM97]|nr:hypothetical protein MSPGM_08010 [Methylorubrum sp. GM97]
MARFLARLLTRRLGRLVATVLEAAGVATVLATLRLTALEFTTLIVPALILTAVLGLLPEILPVILTPVLAVILPRAVLTGIVLTILTLGPILPILALGPVLAVRPVLPEVLPRLAAVVIRPVALEALTPVVAIVAVPALFAGLEALVPVAAIVAIVALGTAVEVVALERLRLLRRVTVLVGAVAEPLATALGALALHGLVVAFLVLVEAVAGIALRDLRTTGLLSAGDDPEIVLAVLKVVLGSHRITARKGVARQLCVLVGDMLSGAADFDVGTVRLVRARQRIRTLGPIATPHPSILVWSHRPRLTLVTCRSA